MVPRLMHCTAGAPMPGRACAIGRAGGHHGEILQGLWWPPAKFRSDPVACLVTLPLAQGGCEAQFTPAIGSTIEVHPAWKVKAARAAHLALDALGAGASGGLLRLNNPIAPGLGLGSSSSDVIATLRAVYNAFGVYPEPDRLARLAVAAETAADPLMYEDVVLFAQRDGVVLERWGSWRPDFLLVSIDTAPEAGGRDTLSLPLPRAHGMRAAYTRLVCQARTAFRTRDAAAIAAVATCSAELHQQTVALRGFEALHRLAGASGALGLQIAHSGTIAGLLFPPQTAAEDLAALLARVRALRMVPRGIFRTGAAPCGAIA